MTRQTCGLQAVPQKASPLIQGCMVLWDRLRRANILLKERVVDEFFDPLGWLWKMLRPKT